MQINITFRRFGENLAQLPNPKIARNETLSTQILASVTKKLLLFLNDAILWILHLLVC